MEILQEFLYFFFSLNCLLKYERILHYDYQVWES